MEPCSLIGKITLYADDEVILYTGAETINKWDLMCLYELLW